MENIKDFFTSILKNIWFGIKTSFLASKKYFPLKCLILISTTVIPLTTIWLWKEILNNISNITNTKNTVILCLLIYLSLKLISYLLQKYDRYLNSRYDDELTFYIEKVMIEKVSRIDLCFFDSASMSDKVQHVRSSFGIMNEMTWLVFDVISEAINIIATFIIISKYNMLIGVITIGLLIPYMLYNKKYTEKRLIMEKEQIRDNRMKDYYKDIFLDNNIQFEIKLNDIGGYFIKRYKELWLKLYKINKKEEIKYTITNTLLSILNSSSEFIVVIVSVFDVINKKIGIGDLQYNINMISRLREQLSLLMTDVNRFIVNNHRLVELQEFITLKPEAEKSGALIPSSNPKIEFCNVWFRYPNNEEFVLKDCSFTLNPHEKIGLIGLNGSGKSTIIKLIFRFYDVEKGSIKLDGVDLKEYDVYAVRKLFGVLFQDYVTYCLPFREIIALSDFQERFNNEKLERACNISGASEIIKDWEEGYDSILGRYYADNGKDLSGGQWQIVGLARAYFKNADYMILDEPSASLDPISEDRIFNQLYSLSEEKSSITISHRLSNTTLSHKILVIDKGHIIEEGSHIELLKQKGKYAQLFNLQASRYI